MRKQFVVALLCAGLSACTAPEPQSPRPAQQAPGPPVELARYPLDSLEGVRAVTGVSFDPAVSHDGKGSLRVDAQGPLTVPLFEVKPSNVDNVMLVYEASLQSEKLDGQAYLEMWVRLPGRGEFYSRGVDRPVTGTMSWVTASTPFFLQPGQKPDLIRLNLVVNGKGRVWIDDLRLLKQPLPGR